MPYMSRCSAYSAVLLAAMAGTPGQAQDAGYAAGYAGARCAASGSCSPDGHVRPVGYSMYDCEDDFDRYSSGFERWCRDVRERIRERRLRGYKRAQHTHHHFLYPQCPPFCSPTFGHFQTQWRPFPTAYQPVWTSGPVDPVWPAPLAEPELLPPTRAPQAVPQPAPGVEPYFPENAPLIEPSETAPPAPTDAPDAPTAQEEFFPARVTVGGVPF
jgi:hypothetical protein